MVTGDERRALQLEHAESNERFWSSLREMNEETAKDWQGHVAKTERTIAENKEAAANAKNHATAARDRITRLKNGEDVLGGLGKPVDMENTLAAAGWSKSDLRHSQRVHAVYELGAEEEYLKELSKGARRREKAAVVRVLRRHLS
jgi:hypothetical protein